MNRRERLEQIPQLVVKMRTKVINAQRHDGRDDGAVTLSRSDLLRLCDALDALHQAKKVIEAARGCPHLKEWLAAYDTFMEGSEE